MACAIIPGCDFAGISMLDKRGRLTSPACTDPLAVQLDQLQVRLDEGPGLEVMKGRAILAMVPDMRCERRWPRFASHAHELGVTSMIACALPRQGGRSAALNLHAAQPGALGSEAAELVAFYADYAAIALSQARLVDSLRSSMDHRQTIGEATGVLMERHRTDSAEAFARLVAASQRLNIKVRDIAEVVVRTGQDPDTLAPEDFTRPSGRLLRRTQPEGHPPRGRLPGDPA